MKYLGWLVLGALIIIVLPFGYFYITAQWITIYIAETAGIRYHVTEALNALNLDEVFDRVVTCDDFWEIDETRPDLLSVVPSSESGFVVKFCDPTEYRINGILPDPNLLGVVGVSALNGILTNQGGDRDIIKYSPTNGAYSEGDLLFRIEEKEGGRISVPDSGVIIVNE